ncbi:hypothetical protein H1R20_g11214, partial [Candolleomyces eurysporus]
MIAARLLPIAVAVVLSLHARLTLALPVNNEDLSLRSVSVANDDASTLALREPSEEIEELAIRTIEDEIMEELLHRGYYDDMDLD